MLSPPLYVSIGNCLKFKHLKKTFIIERNTGPRPEERLEASKCFTDHTARSRESPPSGGWNVYPIQGSSGRTVFEFWVLSSGAQGPSHQMNWRKKLWLKRAQKRVEGQRESRRRREERPRWGPSTTFCLLSMRRQHCCESSWAALRPMQSPFL